MNNNYAYWAWVGPVTWSAWAVAIGLLLLGMRRRARTGRRFVALGLLLYVATAWLPTGYWLIRPLELRFAEPRLEGGGIADIVVLSGAERLASSALSGRLELNEAGERVLEGAVLAERLPEARLWIAGGVAQKGFPIPDVTWTIDSWRRLGLHRTRLGAIGGTLDTCENALGYRALGRSRRPLLVTSAYHMPRSVACFRAAGLDPIPYPVDFRVWPVNGPLGSFSSDSLANLGRVDAALHEWIGLLYYRVAGRTHTLWPEPVP